MIKNKQPLTLLISVIISLLLITTGLSFAYFTANITGIETSTTIEASGGVMTINYEGGENISTPNIFPGNNPFATKTFTLTANNTSSDNMHYHIILVTEENTFRDGAISYNLISENNDNNGKTAPNIDYFSGIKTGKRETIIGNGYFTGGLNNVHTYVLNLYLLKQERFNHHDDQGRVFEAYINIKEGNIYPGYNEEKGVNHPVLFTGMTPVKWDEAEEIITTSDDPDWYDYDEKRWANAKSADGSYWVWIPRYAYKIETCYHTSGEDCYNLTGKEAGDIDIKFLKSTTINTEDNTPVETSGYHPGVKDTSMHYFLHPAFHFASDVPGFWVAKFLPSPTEGVETITGTCGTEDNVTTKTLKVIPDVNSWRCIDIGSSFKVSLELKNKEIYGWQKEEIDTHLLTNQEWGAIAYLSKSKHGAHDEEVWINPNNNLITGCAGDSRSAPSTSNCQEYNTAYGQKNSTTHNIYGVYDMPGNSYERVAGNYNGLVGNNSFTKSEMESIFPEYIIKYSTPEANRLNKIGMDYDKFVYGDAVYEVSNNANRFNGTEWLGSPNGSWYSDISYQPRTTHPWFDRGGSFAQAVGAGMFRFSNSAGEPDVIASFRPALVPR